MACSTAQHRQFNPPRSSAAILPPNDHPNYKRAAAVHDARAAEFIGTFQHFMSKRKR